MTRGRRAASRPRLGYSSSQASRSSRPPPRPDGRFRPSDGEQRTIPHEMASMGRGAALDTLLISPRRGSTEASREEDCEANRRAGDSGGGGHVRERGCGRPSPRGKLAFAGWGRSRRRWLVRGEPSTIRPICGESAPLAKGPVILCLSRLPLRTPGLAVERVRAGPSWRATVSGSAGPLGSPSSSCGVRRCAPDRAAKPAHVGNDGDRTRIARPSFR